MSDDLSCLRGMFKEQRVHIDYRFNELKEDVREYREESRSKDEKQDEQIEALKNRKWRDRTYSAFGGVVGGYLAFFTTQARKFFGGP